MKWISICASCFVAIFAQAQECESAASSTAGKPVILTVSEASAAVTIVNSVATVADWCANNIRGFKALTAGQQKSVVFIIGKFAPYLCSMDKHEEFYLKYLPKKKHPIFVKKGFVMAVLSEKEKVTDLPELAHLRGKKVKEVYSDAYGDGDSGNRLMDELGGEASHRLLVLKSKGIPETLTGKHNTFYHEFSHFFHQSSMTEAQITRLDQLYDEAKEKKQFLDDYASVNESEYFAVGLEAFYSEVKSDKSWIYYGHDKEELKKKDPALFSFISALAEAAQGDASCLVK